MRCKCPYTYEITQQIDRRKTADEIFEVTLDSREDREKYKSDESSEAPCRSLVLNCEDSGCEAIDSKMLKLRSTRKAVSTKQ